MAPAASPTTGQKRGPGRPPKESTPALKKTRLSTAVRSPSPSVTHSPASETTKSAKLPHTLSAQLALPITAEPQAPTLSDSEYQSIAESAVFQASLERSRQVWIHDGVFERYWTKPESGKNARPTPPNNPELKWQKQKGPCRIRIEPHIFEAEMYVEEKPKPAPAPVVKHQPYGIQPGGAYGQAYRPGGQQTYGGQPQQGQYYNGARSLPPVQQHPIHFQGPGHGAALPVMAPNQQAAPFRAQKSPAPRPTPPTQPDKKPSPDPVISALATRAATDPELKALMKEVATGNATQDQLKIFQGHIDTLTKTINDEKKKEEEAAAAAQAAREKQQQSEMIQYDGASDAVPIQQPQQQPFQPQHPPYQQQTWQPPPPPAPPAPPAPPQPQPVVLSFTAPGSTEDRFLFPQHSILEPLSPQHLLASFIVTRRGSQAADSTDLEPQKEYWQPVTCMVEVAYNREHLLECVKKWVKPASEVREWMESIMKRCTPAPDSHLVLRLPKKGTEMAAEPEEVLGSGGEEIKAALAEVKEKKTVKYVKKADRAKEEKSKAAVELNGAKKDGAVVDDAGTPAVSAPKDSAVNGEQKADAPAEDKKGDAEQETTESGRPKRTVRKSVRISEGA